MAGEQRTSGLSIWSLKALLAAAAVTVAGAAGRASASTVGTPIAATGWNVDNIVENQSPWSATEFTTANTAGLTWMETRGSYAGFPAQPTAGSPTYWTSQIQNTVTGGNTLFQFQPYGTATGGSSPNVLTVAHNATATLTFTTDTSMSSLSILATTLGGSGATANGTLTIDFQNGSTLTGVPYNNPNWTSANQTNTSGTVVNANTTPWSLANPSSTSGTTAPSVSGTTAYLFETDIDLTQYTVGGSNASTLPIAKIVFGGPISGSGTTGVFAITAVPEPITPAIFVLSSLTFLRRGRKRRAV